MFDQRVVNPRVIDFEKKNKKKNKNKVNFEEV